jgi:hypothetical protein
LKCKSVKALWRATELEDKRLLLANFPNAKWVMIQIFQLNEEKCMYITMNLVDRKKEIQPRTND